MSHKAKRRAYSELSPFQRWLQKISDFKPSALVITIILISYAVFLFGGALFAIVNPLMPPYINNNFIFIYPDITSQFISENIISVTIYLMGFAGIIYLYRSTKFVYKPRQAYINAIMGASLLLIAYLILEGVLLRKIG